jgi:predicted anti-sigma-YlaC factor YlaD
MPRFVILLAILASLVVPALAFDTCGDCTKPRAWYVEVGDGGSCYVRYRQRPKQYLPTKFVSAQAAYKAIARSPACPATAAWLRQFSFVHR